MSLRRQRPNLRQRAVDARKLELVALGASELLSHVNIDIGFENLDALKAVCRGVEVNVRVCKGWVEAARMCSSCSSLYGTPVGFRSISSGS